MTSPQEPRITLPETDIIGKPQDREPLPSPALPVEITAEESHKAYLRSQTKVLQYEVARRAVNASLTIADINILKLIKKGHEYFPMGDIRSEMLTMLATVEEEILRMKTGLLFHIDDDIPF